MAAMRCSRHAVFTLGLVVGMGMGGLQAAGAGDEKVGQLIRRAGNADRDEDRLALLKELEGMAGLDERIRADAARMRAEVDKWLDGRRLPYFGGQVSAKQDYDFGIAADSPLYPLTHLYRGRMVIWYTMEDGGVWSVPEKRRAWMDKARECFEAARKAFPENRVARMYLGEPIGPRRELEVVAGAPGWAAAQRECLERWTDIIEWWIDHRMRPNCEFGGGWGDDCEMWRLWVPVMIGFDEPKIVQAQARFSEAMMSQPHMKDGYTSQITDVEHTAEDSADVITPMMHLDPDNDVWKQRALRLADLMETLWTGRNERGFLQFKSTYFCVNRVDGNPQRACDTTYHPKAVQPTLLYWQRTGNARLGKLFATWMDTWVDAAARAERGKPAGVIPTAIHWPDGKVGGLGEDWWNPKNHGEETLYRWPSALYMMAHTLLLTYHMTGNEKYLEPLQSMAKIRLAYLKERPEDPPEGSALWCGVRLGWLTEVAAKFKLLTGRGDFDELLMQDSRAYIAFRLRGERKGMEAALRESAQGWKINFEGFTSEVRYTDRVLRFPALFDRGMMLPREVESIRIPDPALLYSTVTGDPGGAGFFPMNAVRWLTRPREIAALVVDSGPERFTAELFHFGSQPRAMAAELYLLSPGKYRFYVRPMKSESREPKDAKPFEVTGARTRIGFTLPARVPCVLEVRRVP